jgi:MOSC domain-containing protein YiiM
MKKKFLDILFNWGMFGKKLTTIGLFKSQVNIEDMFQIESPQVVATQLRTPCFKLGGKLGKINILQKDLEVDKSGIYFKVVKEDKIGTDASINLIKKDNNNDVTIENIVELVTEYKDNKFTYGKSSLRSPKMLETLFS